MNKKYSNSIDIVVQNILQNINSQIGYGHANLALLRLSQIISNYSQVTSKTAKSSTPKINSTGYEFQLGLSIYFER